jgi:hypothetical protein
MGYTSIRSTVITGQTEGLKVSCGKNQGFIEAPVTGLLSVY